MHALAQHLLSLTANGLHLSRYLNNGDGTHRRWSVLNLGEAQGQNQVRLIVFSSHFPLKIDDQSRNQVRLKPLSLTGAAALDGTDFYASSMIVHKTVDIQKGIHSMVTTSCFTDVAAKGVSMKISDSPMDCHKSPFSSIHRTY
jgi:hypothetical protein